MTFDEYQAHAKETAIYPDAGNNFVYPTLGLAGEAGEVAEKMKKVLRDKAGVIDRATAEDIAKELGDVLWYIATLSTELKLSLEEVAAMNVKKLASRKERDALHGGGDNR